MNEADRIKKLEKEIQELRSRKSSRERREGLRTVDGKISYEMTPEEKELVEARRWAIDSMAPRATMSERFRIVTASILDREIYDPPQEKIVPKEGAWVMILRPPTVHQIQVARGQVFYAIHDDGADDRGFSRRGYYKIRITTPQGTLWIWPYEYSVMDTHLLLDLWDKKELLFHPLVGNVRLNDAVFYIRSRGIALADAMVMALGTLKGPVGWFEPTPEIAGMIEDVYGGVA